MRHLKLCAALSLALAAGAASADNFCNGGHFFNDDWEGSRCDVVQRTVPGEGTSGAAGNTNGEGGGGEDDIPGLPIGATVQPAYSDLDLRPYYPRGDKTPLGYNLYLHELNLVGSDVSVDILQFGLEAPPTAGEGESCWFTMSVGYNAVVAGGGRYVRFLWTCADANGAAQSTWTTAALDSWTSRLEIMVTPADGDWKRFSVAGLERSTYVERKLVFDNRTTFAAPASWALPYLQPASLRAGLIAGSLQRGGMTTRWEFHSPVIVEGPMGQSGADLR